jgi:hypothetical protein
VRARLALGVLFLAGCAAPADMISFDRGAFALMYSDLVGSLRQACDSGRLTTIECSQLAAADHAARQAIVSPTKAAKTSEDLMTIFFRIGSAAARAYGFPVPPPSKP